MEDTCDASLGLRDLLDMALDCARLLSINSAGPEHEEYGQPSTP